MIKFELEGEEKEEKLRSHWALDGFSRSSSSRFCRKLKERF